MMPLSRRSLMIGTAGLTATLGTVGAWVAWPASPPIAGEWLNRWLILNPDGGITLLMPGMELGQGAWTSLAMLVAEELEIDCQDLRQTAAPLDGAYGNPVFDQRQITADSKTTLGYWPVLRQAGAEARARLLASAARLWRVPVDSLTLAGGIIRHPASGRQTGFAALAGHLAPAPAEIHPKPASAWRLIGRSPPRLDGPDKVSGRAIFGLDARHADAVKAVFVRPPAPGLTPLRIDDAATRAVPGVLAVVSLPQGVAVVAHDSWAALQGQAALRVDWPAIPPLDSARVLADFAALAASDTVPTGPTIIGHKILSDQPVTRPVQRRLTLEFLADPVAHAMLEPMNALVDPAWLGRKLTITTSTQAPSLVMRSGLRTGKTIPHLLTFHPLLAGGGFGRRIEQDATDEAIALAQHLGRAVQVFRRREEEFSHGVFRQLAAQRLTLGLDAQNQPALWAHRQVADSVLARLFAGRPLPNDEDHTVTAGQLPAYHLPGGRIDAIFAQSGIAAGFLRGVGGGYTVWAIESMIDEAARASGQSPLAFRLALLPDARDRQVLERVAELAGSAPYGLGFCRFRGSRIAVAAQVTVDRISGQVQAQQLWIVIDGGVIVHPDAAHAQIEGAALMAVSLALKEHISLREGRVEQSNFHDYPLLRLSETPAVMVKFLPSVDDFPHGLGEIALPPTVAALGNAIAVTCGARMTRLPFLPDRVQAALALGAPVWHP